MAQLNREVSPTHGLYSTRGTNGYGCSNGSIQKSNHAWDVFIISRITKDRGYSHHGH